MLYLLLLLGLYFSSFAVFVVEDYCVVAVDVFGYFQFGLDLEIIFRECLLHFS